MAFSTSKKDREATQLVHTILLSLPRLRPVSNTKPQHSFNLAYQPASSTASIRRGKTQLITFEPYIDSLLVGLGSSIIIIRLVGDSSP
jgi:hypothetical protein